MAKDVELEVSPRHDARRQQRRPQQVALLTGTESKLAQSGLENERDFPSRWC